MANREALRELQIRLASRLQAARSETVSVSSWLAVESAGERYLLPLVQSGEIFPWTSVQPVPYTRDWFLGVANLRGGLTGVIDLARLMGHISVRSEQTLAESSLLAFNAALEVNAALLVDRLAGLRDLEGLTHGRCGRVVRVAWLGRLDRACAGGEQCYRRRRNSTNGRGGLGECDRQSR